MTKQEREQLEQELSAGESVLADMLDEADYCCPCEFCQAELKANIAGVALRLAEIHRLLHRQCRLSVLLAKSIQEDYCVGCPFTDDPMGYTICPIGSRIGISSLEVLQKNRITELELELATEKEVSKAIAIDLAHAKFD